MGNVRVTHYQFEQLREKLKLIPSLESEILLLKQQNDELNKQIQLLNSNKKSNNSTKDVGVTCRLCYEWSDFPSDPRVLCDKKYGDGVLEGESSEATLNTNSSNGFQPSYGTSSNLPIENHSKSSTDYETSTILKSNGNTFSSLSFNNLDVMCNEISPILKVSPETQRDSKNEVPNFHFSSVKTSLHSESETKPQTFERMQSWQNISECNESERLTLMEPMEIDDVLKESSSVAELRKSSETPKRCNGKIVNGSVDSPNLKVRSLGKTKVEHGVNSSTPTDKLSRTLTHHSPRKVIPVKHNQKHRNYSDSFNNSLSDLQRCDSFSSLGITNPEDHSISVKRTRSDSKKQNCSNFGSSLQIARSKKTTSISTCSSPIKKRELSFTNLSTYTPCKVAEHQKCQSEVFEIGEDANEQESVAKSNKAASLFSDIELLQLRSFQLRLRTKPDASLSEMITKKWFDRVKNYDLEDVEQFVDIVESFTNSDVSRSLVNVTDTYDNTALHYFIADRKISSIRFLIQVDGINCDIRNKAGFSPAHLATALDYGSEENVEIIRNLFSRSNLTLTNQSGNTPLMMACVKDNLEAVQMLLDLGSDVNVENSEGFTALMLAAENGNDQIVSSILNSQPNCNVATKNNQGRNAVSVALNNGHKQLAMTIYNSCHSTKSAPNTPLSKRKELQSFLL